MGVFVRVLNAPKTHGQVFRRPEIPLDPATLIPYSASVSSVDIMCVCVCVCVCVSTPGQRVFHHHLSQAGGRSAIASLLPTKTLAIGSETRPDQSGVPAFNTLTPMVHPVAVSLFPWSFMLPPPNKFPTAAFSRRSSAALLQMSEQIVKHFSCADLFTLRFPHLPSQRGN